METAYPGPDPDLPHLIQGQLAHCLAEVCLRHQEQAEDYIGHSWTINERSYPVDAEMAAAVQIYLDNVRSFPGHLFIEHKIDFSPWVPNGFGTLDAAVINGDTAVILDLKFGRGVPVKARYNPQLMIYAIGLLHTLDPLQRINTFRLSIIQPRQNRFASWTISRQKLLRWGARRLRAAAHIALSDAPPFHPGITQCRFCRARSACRALMQFHLQTAVQAGGAEDAHGHILPPDRITPQEMASMFPRLRMFERWLHDFKRYAIAEMQRGTVFPGYALATTQRPRQWIDPKQAEAALAARLPYDTLFRKKFMSPAAIENRLGKGDPLIEQLSFRPMGQPVIIPSAVSPLANDSCTLSSPAHTDALFPQDPDPSTKPHDHYPPHG